MAERVLLIDDDPNVLSGLKRQLRNSFDVTTANGGAEAVETVKTSAPFAVVVSDMRMPGIDGVETLEKIRKIAPETVRTMLTGNADQQTAIDAINKGNIFRFFNKPCPKDVMEEGLIAAVRQYKLVTAEKNLLEQTLAGSVKVLTDVLALSDPELFQQSARIREWAKKIKPKLSLEYSWHLDLAAMLAPIGRVAVPKETLNKEKKGEALSTAEQQLIARVPEISRDLISNIPRLKDVAEIIYYQDKNFDGSGFPVRAIGEESTILEGESIPQISRLLKILNVLAQVSKTAMPAKAEFDFIEKSSGMYDPDLLKLVRRVLDDQNTGEEASELLEIGINLIRAGDILQADLKNCDNQLLLAVDYEITDAQVRRLRELANLGQIKGSATVLRISKPS